MEKLGLTKSAGRQGKLGTEGQAATAEDESSVSSRRCPRSSKPRKAGGGGDEELERVRAAEQAEARCNQSGANLLGPAVVD